MEKNSYIFVNNPTNMKNFLLKAVIAVAIGVLAFQLILILLCITGQDGLLNSIASHLIY